MYVEERLGHRLTTWLVTAMFLSGVVLIIGLAVQQVAGPIVDSIFGLFEGSGFNWAALGRVVVALTMVIVFLCFFAWGVVWFLARSMQSKVDQMEQLPQRMKDLLSTIFRDGLEADPEWLESVRKEFYAEYQGGEGTQEWLNRQRARGIDEGK